MSMRSRVCVLCLGVILATIVNATQASAASTKVLRPAPFGLQDTDGDGIPDVWETQVYHTDPLKADTDGDGVDDWTEIINGTNPDGKGAYTPKDYDGDGLDDRMELLFGTDPTKKDTDGDGFTDGQEVPAGFSPTSTSMQPLGKTIVVSLSKQQLQQDLGGITLATYKVSTGKASTPTPKGTFHVINKDPRAWSHMASLWMPWWIQFTRRATGCMSCLNGRMAQKKVRTTLAGQFPQVHPSRCWTGEKTLLTDTVGNRHRAEMIYVSTPKVSVTAVALALAVTFVFPANVLAATKPRTPVLLKSTKDYPVKKNEFASAVVIDAATGKRLYSYQPDLEWSAASLSKLMNALVTVGEKPNWNRIVALSTADEVGGGRLRVNDGAKMSMLDLLYSAIAASANNAAMALARVSPLGTKKFVAAMNAKALKLGMTHTTFVGPSGIEAENTSTANDLAKLATAAFNDPIIRQVASTSYYSFVVRNTGDVHKLTNTDKLLVDPNNGLWVSGGKTGFIYESQYNVIVRMRADPPDPQKPTVLVVVLGAPTNDASFASAESLAKWAWNAYDWQPTK